MINVISSFLEQRSAPVDYLPRDALHHFSKDCLQVSFLSLALLESLLRCIGDNLTLKAYADDIPLLVWGRSRAALESNDRKGMYIIEQWSRENVLRISIDKSSVLTFGNPKVFKLSPIFKIL